MEQFIRTYHNYDDDTVNADIKKRLADGWKVKHLEYSTQTVNGKVKACVIILYEKQ